MGSPFPGMDPYLEGEMWQEFHGTLINAIRAQLMPQLRPKYVAFLAKRYVLDRPLAAIDEPGIRVIYPDVHVVEADDRRLREIALAYGVMAPTVELASPVVEEVPLLSVEIRDVAERRLVTLIEILSPVNKRGDGARDYGNRRLEILQTATHLLEIDLLCQGERIQLLGEPPPASYYVYLSRVERRPYTQVWAVSLRSRLPAIPVPLLRPDPDAVLDLQAALTACFDLVGYENLLDYATAPPPGLSQEDASWAIRTLQAAKVRT